MQLCPYIIENLDMSPFSTVDASKKSFHPSFKTFCLIKTFHFNDHAAILSKCIICLGCFVDRKFKLHHLLLQRFAKLSNCYSVKWSGKSVLIHGVFRLLTGTFLTDIIKKKYKPNLFYFQFSSSSVMYEISLRLLQIFIIFFFHLSY